ncbi:uncharacterized protein MELLADRAFT_112673 [Melampsora larici-populina 98AG31]|uniref:Uncharacterized protein n=1 Tax=Melampsora larici-populina (strain 98AG31 / pathotype 3-4-7) TaxID=747676 RepID=F4S785_MELLP|nr:uncharacterized protein MELLADRAFT_112673 [Melampsora larici-populina 98AG31]EGF99470.1 hypothetical protein MELLADRAFT_112673 [Melampsora larici-populina 98AG31]
MVECRLSDVGLDESVVNEARELISLPCDMEVGMENYKVRLNKKKQTGQVVDLENPAWVICCREHIDIIAGSPHLLETLRLAAGLVSFQSSPSHKSDQREENLNAKACSLGAILLPTERLT